MTSIFKKSIELNMKIEKFLDTISNSISLFEKEIGFYLNDDYDTFNDTFERIRVLETEADQLEIDITVSLYKFMLLPDVRADVLSLINSMDNIIDATKAIAKDFYIQKPKFPPNLKKDILDLISNTVKTVDALISSTRSFFNEVHLTSAYISKIKFYEHEVDILEDKINSMIFNDSLVEELAEKIQLKSFVSKIAYISDECEVIGDKLTIFAIKREI